MDRTVVAITGASSGIGEAFARKLAPGHDLLLIARRKDRLDGLAEEFSGKFGTKSETLAADLADDGQLAMVADRIASEPRLSLLVNNAGLGVRGRFWEAQTADLERMQQIHIIATMRLTHAALRGMIARDFGGIVNVGSVASFLRSPGNASYSASKAWISAFTEGLSLDLKSARSSILVQALCPGFTYSEFHDAMGQRPGGLGPGWWLTAEEVVEASIDGLRRRKLFVIPGWRYKAVTAIIPRLPAALRLRVEAIRPREQHKRLPVNVDSRKQISADE